MEGKKRNREHVQGIMIFVSFLFGVNPMVVKMGILAMPPTLFTTCRLFVASIAFVIFLVWSKTYKRVEKKDWSMFLLMGGAAFVFQIGMIYSLHYVSAATVATMIAIMPISVLFIHSRMDLQVIKRQHYIGAVFTIIGVFLISGVTGNSISGEAHSPWIGILLMLIAQFAAGWYTVFSEKAVQKYSHYQVVTLMYIIAFVLLFIFSIPEMVTYKMSNLSVEAILCIVYGGVVSLCIANNLWVWGIKRIGSHRAAVYNNLPPIFALIVGGIFLNEIPMGVQVIGILIVLLGLYVFRQGIKN